MKPREPNRLRVAPPAVFSAASDIQVPSSEVHHIGKLFEIVKEHPVSFVCQRGEPAADDLWRVIPGHDGSLCQSALAAFLFSPAGLLALVAIIRHSERVTTAFIATMATKTS
jgi:hypothetical protein